MELTREQQILQTVINKAWHDASFKEELITNPVEAIEKLTGEQVTLPEGKTLSVFDQSNSDVIYLNIPAQPNLEDVELTDSQLEMVAGGTIPLILVPDPTTCPPIFEPPFPLPTPSPTIPPNPDPTPNW